MEEKVKCQHIVWNLLMEFEGALLSTGISDHGSRKLVRELLETERCDGHLNRRAGNGSPGLADVRESFLKHIRHPREDILALGNPALDEPCGQAVAHHRYYWV